MSITNKSWSLVSACCLGIAALAGGCGGEDPALDESSQDSYYGSAHCTVAAISPGGGHGLYDDVQLQEDLTAIDELKSRYVYAVDGSITDPAQVDNILSLMTDDVCFEYGSYGTFRGKASIKRFFKTTAPALAAWSFHVTTNPLLTVNGSNGTGQWRILSFGVLKAAYSAGVQDFFANYSDAFVKTQTGWKIRTIIARLDTPPTGP